MVVVGCTGGGRFEKNIGFMMSGFWFLAFVVSWFLLAPKMLGFEVSWFLASKDSWFQSFLVSKTLGLKVSMIPDCQQKSFPVFWKILMVIEHDQNMP